VKVYHATPRTNLSSILQDGLYGGGGFDPAHAAELSWAEPADLVDFVSNLFAIAPSDVVVLELDITGLAYEEGWDGEGTVAINETVPPSRIKVVTH
jgi:RNA:NAD 2'-phosphotransferase (TPT1/KptA family)